MIWLFVKFYFKPTAKHYRKLRRAMVRRQHRYEDKQSSPSDINGSPKCR